MSMNAFLEANLAYLSLLTAVVVSSMLYVVILYQVQKLRCSLVFHRQRVENLESQLSVLLGGKALPAQDEEPGRPTPDATRDKVLHLHGLGRTREEIARQAGIREAEVDFVLKVNEHVETHSGALALRKIS